MLSEIRVCHGLHFCVHACAHAHHRKPYDLQYSNLGKVSYAARKYQCHNNTEVIPIIYQYIQSSLIEDDESFQQDRGEGRGGGKSAEPFCLGL